MDEHAFKSLSQITRIDTNYNEVVEMIPKPVGCILASVKSAQSVVRIPPNHPCNFGHRVGDKIACVHSSAFVSRFFFHFPAALPFSATAEGL